MRSPYDIAEDQLKLLKSLKRMEEDRNPVIPSFASGGLVGGGMLGKEHVFNVRDAADAMALAMSRAGVIAREAGRALPFLSQPSASPETIAPLEELRAVMKPQVQFTLNTEAIIKAQAGFGSPTS